MMARALVAALTLAALGAAARADGSIGEATEVARNTHVDGQGARRLIAPGDAVAASNTILTDAQGKAAFPFRGRDAAVGRAELQREARQIRVRGRGHALVVRHSRHQGPVAIFDRARRPRGLSHSDAGRDDRRARHRLRREGRGRPGARVRHRRRGRALPPTRGGRALPIAWNVAPASRSCPAGRAHGSCRHRRCRRFAPTRCCRCRNSPACRMRCPARCVRRRARSAMRRGRLLARRPERSIPWVRRRARTVGAVGGAVGGVAGGVRGAVGGVGGGIGRTLGGLPRVGR